MNKLNLDGLSEWSPHNAGIARELLLSYHDTFVLECDVLGMQEWQSASRLDYYLSP